MSISQTMRLSWLQRPGSYAICAPIVTAAGAATTIAAPILLDPASFVSYALLISIFQYVGEFDLGLARLTDRVFSDPNANDLRPFIMARSCVAAGLAGVVLMASPFTGVLAAVAGLAGVAFMVSLGPISFYRARSNTAAFILAAVLMQSGLSVPRFMGLMIGGVTGCIYVLLGWFTMTAIVLHIPFKHVLRDQNHIRLPSIFAASFPLCVFNSLWLLYLIASRWFAWLLSTATDAGLFAFGVNLLSVGVALIAVIGQAYYPRHLANRDKSVLYRELIILTIILTGGVLVGELFCRFVLGLVFPRFNDAASTAAIILLTGIPLSLCAWLVPLVISKSERPWREALIMFGVCLASLYGLMSLGSHSGIQGQAWAGIPPAFLLLAMELHLLVRGNLLDRRNGVRVWFAAVVVDLVCGAVWYASFDMAT